MYIYSKVYILFIWQYKLYDFDYNFIRPPPPAQVVNPPQMASAKKRRRKWLEGDTGVCENKVPSPTHQS